MSIKILDKKIYFCAIYILFCAVILGATLYYAPGWGVMDDASNLVITFDFWRSPSINAFCNMAKTEMSTLGRFRPLYLLWSIIVHSVFHAFPVGAYLLIALAGLASLLLWGRMINKIFPVSADTAFNFFVYPLSFFIFTPFWNNFMYISIQEKFIYLFTTLSFYFFIRSYQANKASYLAISIIFMILGVLSKETGVALVSVFCVYSLLDCLVFRKNKKFSLIVFTLSVLMFTGHYFLIRAIWGGSYSVTYKNNFNILHILRAFLLAPIVIKGLVVMALIFACAGAVFIVRKKENPVSQEYVLFPLFLGAYLVVLSPWWGFLNYHLGPIAPPLMLTVYPVYMFISAKIKWLGKALNVILIVLAFLVLFFIIVPRISKMGDTKKVVSAIISLRGDSRAGRFFMAPPFKETALAMQIYTNAGIVYLSKGMLSADMLESAAVNYIIFEDRCTPVELRDVVAKKEVYSNKTWRIFSLGGASGKSSAFAPAFEKNLLQRIKDRIKEAR